MLDVELGCCYFSQNRQKALIFVKLNVMKGRTKWSDVWKTHFKAAGENKKPCPFQVFTGWWKYSWEPKQTENKATPDSMPLLLHWDCTHTSHASYTGTDKYRSHLSHLIYSHWLHTGHAFFAKAVDTEAPPLLLGLRATPLSLTPREERPHLFLNHTDGHRGHAFFPRTHR